jgi:hypothetical protein
MHDELLAGAPALVGVVLAGEDERGGHGLAVDRDERVLGVLFDDREQVAEQPALVVLQDGDLRDADRCGLV